MKYVIIMRQQVDYPQIICGFLLIICEHHKIIDKCSNRLMSII